MIDYVVARRGSGHSITLGKKYKVQSWGWFGNMKKVDNNGFWIKDDRLCDVFGRFGFCAVLGADGWEFYDGNKQNKA